VGFSEARQKFERAGVTVIGVSKDSVESHDKFKAKYKLKIQLGSDPETKVAKTYGTWVEKSMYGRKYMGMDRATFLIDGKGVIREVWRKVKVPGHVDEVLAAAKSL
jgi:peroxiredoxin Q/BCP